MKFTKEELRSKITAFEADISSYRAQISRHESEKANLLYRQKISKNENEIENLKEEVHYIDLKIEELNDRIEHIKKLINRLFTMMTALVKQEAA